MNQGVMENPPGSQVVSRDPLSNIRTPPRGKGGKGKRLSFQRIIDSAIGFGRSRHASRGDERVKKSDNRGACRLSPRRPADRPSVRSGRSRDIEGKTRPRSTVARKYWLGARFSSTHGQRSGME